MLFSPPHNSLYLSFPGGSIILFVIGWWQHWAELISWLLRLDDYTVLPYKGGVPLRCNVWRSFDLRSLWVSFFATSAYLSRREGGLGFGYSFPFPSSLSLFSL